MVIVRVIVVLMFTLVKFPFTTIRVLTFVTDFSPDDLFLASKLSNISSVCLFVSSTFDIERFGRFESMGWIFLLGVTSLRRVICSRLENRAELLLSILATSPWLDRTHNFKADHSELWLEI